jgi:hypothetical protein
VVYLYLDRFNRRKRARAPAAAVPGAGPLPAV